MNKEENEGKDDGAVIEVDESEKKIVENEKEEAGMEEGEAANKRTIFESDPDITLEEESPSKKQKSNEADDEAMETVEEDDDGQSNGESEAMEDEDKAMETVVEAKTEEEVKAVETVEETKNDSSLVFTPPNSPSLVETTMRNSQTRPRLVLQRLYFLFFLSCFSPAG